MNKIKKIAKPMVRDEAYKNIDKMKHRNSKYDLISHQKL